MASDIRNLLTVQPRSLRSISGRPLSLGQPLTLTAASRSAAGQLAESERIAAFDIRRGLDRHSFALMPEAGVDWPALSVDAPSAEAFAVHCDRRGIFARANSDAGLRYARGVVGQLLKTDRRTLPAMVIQDGPAMDIRAVMVDLSRTCTEKLDSLRGLIDRLAEYRCNQLQLYFEERLAFTKHPKLAHPMAYTLAQMDKLGRYAKARGVDLVPQLATLGHCQGFLQVPAYRKLADGDQIYQLNPLHPGTRRMLGDMLDDWASIAHSPYVHAAFDEAPYFGRTRQTRDYIRRHGVEGFMATHLRFLHDHLAGLGLRMMVWGDMLKHYPGTLDRIPSDIMIVEWGYDAVGSAHVEAIDLFQQKGFDVLVAPAASRSAQMHFPRRGQITQNIPDFLRLGLKMNVAGAIICQWEALPRFTRWSEPGFALGCRLGWEGRSGKAPAMRREICRHLVGTDGTAADRVFEKLSPDLLLNRFRRVHFDPAEKLKTYHLDTHEIFATDPLIYLRYGASAWAKRVSQRYETGVAEALAEFDGDGALDRTMRFSARACLLLGYKRTKINEAGVHIRAAAKAFTAGRTQACLGELARAVGPVEQLGELAGALERDAMGVWTLSRYRNDPTFERMYGRRLSMAKAGCKRLVRAIHRCERSVRSGGAFTLADYIAGRNVYCFRLGLRAASGINIVNLRVELSDDGSAWRHDRVIHSFQPAGSEYAYMWMPLGEPARHIRVEVLRTQAAWTPADLEIDLYRLLGPTEKTTSAGRRNSASADVIDTEEYLLGRRTDLRYRRVRSTGTTGRFTLSSC